MPPHGNTLFGNESCRTIAARNGSAGASVGVLLPPACRSARRAFAPDSGIRRDPVVAWEAAPGPGRR